jgi:FtsP/CotA-like multicopper oxidase with cupredoxin domain
LVSQIENLVHEFCSSDIGQRYDVIIHANQTVGNYWFRVSTGGGGCDGPNEKTDTAGSIFRYVGASSDQPITTSYSLPTGCVDETNLVPYVSLNADLPTSAPTALDLTLDTSASVAWKVNNLSMGIDWTKPTLQYVENGTYTLPADDNGLVINGANNWTYWLIQNDTPLPHPIHLHGHDFFVLATGSGSGTNAALSVTNPIRRDTHTAPANGYTVIAFKADNPGAWLLHCHIAFHISSGLGVQFLERPAEIIGTIGNLTDFNNGCTAWSSYTTSVTSFSQGDSGL